MNIQSIVELNGIGAETAKKYEKLGITTSEDLLFHLPYRYDDFSNTANIADLKPGKSTVKGVFHSVASNYRRKGIHLTTAVFADETGEVSVVWFNQPYRAKSIQEDVEFYLVGDLQFNGKKYTFTNPSIEQITKQTKLSAMIRPVYPETKGLTSKKIHSAVMQVLRASTQIDEIIPDTVREKNGQPPVSSALRWVHHPKTMDEAVEGQRYFQYFELFALMCANEISRVANDSQKTKSITFSEAETKYFTQSLPFTLTDAQRKAAWRILQDLGSRTPMNRLLEGDVGSGKTIVAAIAMLNVSLDGCQSALLAPTELLARQHYKSISETLEKTEVSVALLVSAMTKSEKNVVYQHIEDGSVDIVVGTQALLQDAVSFSDLSLVVIDEQHRFGVSQRQQLLSKSRLMPHILTMTATPIPRTLALTVYGELDISVLDEVPKGRKPAETVVINPNSKTAMHARVFKELNDGNQGFVVFPLIEESEMLQSNDLLSGYEKAKHSIYKEWRCEILHGKMTTDEKQQVMSDFVAKKIDVLFSTTVIEVGVDVPNATFMIIESAERFGLAQLHQLRGRIGRSDKQSYCFLVPTSSSNTPKRLHEMTRISNGFELAEIDLELRGPGAIYGTQQHGSLDVNLLNLSDSRLLTTVKSDARYYINTGEKMLKYSRLRALIDSSRSITKLN